MAHTRPVRHEPAYGVVRPRRAARRRSNDDARAVSIAAVTLYHAPDCSLCARAIEVVEEVRAELGFELALVDIAGVPELEERYRALLPAVEIDGELAFTYFVDAAALRERFRARA